MKLRKFFSVFKFHHHLKKYQQIFKTSNGNNDDDNDIGRALQARGQKT